MLIFLFPFLIYIIFFTQIGSVLKTEVRENNMANLKSQSLQIDNAVDNLMQVAFNVYYNTTADVIANYPDGTFDTENRYNAFSMCEILKDYEKDVPYIKKNLFLF